MYKEWLIGFFSLSLFVVILMEVNYRVNKKNYYRHAEDYTVNKLLENEVNQKRKTVLMGDSVTHWPLEGLQVIPEIYDLSATSSMTMVGQYMLLYRYLQQNNAPEDVYFFFIPEAMLEDAHNTYSVVESIFDKPDEVKTIKMLKKGGYSEGDSYFYDRIRILKFWKQYFAHGQHTINIKAVQQRLVKKQVLEIDINQKYENIRMNEQSKFVIKEFVSLTKKHNINIHFVLEPLRSDNYLAYLHSDIAYFLQTEEIELIDFRKIFVFNDNDFYDGVHLNGVNADTYAYLIDREIVAFLNE